MPDRAGKRQKDNQLSEAIRAVTEMPTMDAAVEKVLDVVFVTLQSSPDAEPVNCVARRYLEYLQENQKEETEMICKKVKRTIPDYTFATQHPQPDGMEF